MFKRIDPRQYAFLRILFGLFALDTLFHLHRIADFFYSDAGWYPTSTALKLNNPMIWSLLYMVTSPDGVRLFMDVIAVAAVCMIVGYRSRLANLIVFAGMVSIFHRNAYPDCSEDTVLTITCFYLLFAPTGAAWSVDSFLKRYRKKLSGINSQNFRESLKQEPETKLSPAWPMIFLQIQVALIYLNTGLDKWRSVEWPAGTALRTFMMDKPFARWNLEPIMYNPIYIFVMKMMSWVTLVWEVSFSILVLNRWTRWLALAIGVMIHVGILVLLQVHVFSCLMISTYVAFLPNHYFIKLENWIKKKWLAPAPSPAMALFDGEISLCMKVAVFLSMVDVTKKVEWIPAQDETRWRERAPNLKTAEVRDDFHFIGTDGSVVRGTDGVASLISTIPALVLVRILCILPGILNLVTWMVTKKIRGDKSILSRLVRTVFENSTFYRMRAKQFAIVTFCILHFGAVVWMILPSSQYNTNDRLVNLPGILNDMEKVTVQTKRYFYNSWFATAARRYTFVTGTRQGWGMFAPNPMLPISFIEVRVVTGWRKANAPLAADSSITEKGLVPIYAPTPLYQSFFGTMDQRKQSMGGLDPYLRDSKLAQYLARPDSGGYLNIFAQHWDDVYTRRFKKKPLGIQVVLYQGYRKSPFAPVRTPASEEYEAKVIATIDHRSDNVQKH